MKKLLVLVIGFLFTVVCCGCLKQEKTPKPRVEDDTFFCKILDEEEVAIGSLRHYEDGQDNYFIPERIGEYKVSQLGYASGLYVRAEGTFTQSDKSRVKKIYAPHTIEAIYDGYLMWAGVGFELMYCGSLLDLRSCEADTRYVTYYVPSNEFKLFKEVFTGKEEQLKMANLVYDYNYSEYEYYYVDYIELGEKIVNIPPNPKRDGYTFGGWYKDNTLTQEWDFTNDVIILEEDSNEIRLFAKWN